MSVLKQSAAETDQKSQLATTLLFRKTGSEHAGGGWLALPGNTDLAELSMVDFKVTRWESVLSQFQLLMDPAEPEGVEIVGMRSTARSTRSITHCSGP